jgi:hypothetical protein
MIFTKYFQFEVAYSNFKSRICFLFFYYVLSYLEQIKKWFK